MFQLLQMHDATANSLKDRFFSTEVTTAGLLWKVIAIDRSVWLAIITRQLKA